MVNTQDFQLIWALQQRKIKVKRNRKKMYWVLGREKFRKL